MFSSNDPSSADIVQPTYILTDRLPGSEIPLLLGRIVAHFASPTDEYFPEDPRIALHSKILEIVDTDFSTLFAGSKNKPVESKIGQILGVSSEDGHNNQSRLQSKLVRTRTLSQHREALKALLQQFRPQILQLLKDNEGVAYMIVGIKSALDAEHATERQFGKRTALTIGLPTAAIVTAATHGMVNLGQGADIDINSGKTQGQAFESAATMEGEQVFAIRYRLIKLKTFFLGMQEPVIALRTIKRAPLDQGLYSGVEEKICADETETDANDNDENDEYVDEDVAMNEKMLEVELNKRSDIVKVTFSG